MQHCQGKYVVLIFLINCELQEFSSIILSVVYIPPKACVVAVRPYNTWLISIK